jgi:ketosteroid isomerase-like protein
MSTIAPTIDAAAEWQQDIRELEERARTAFLAADIPTLDAMWADAFVVNSPLNVINDKARVVELLRAGRIRHSTYDVEIEHMSRHGDVVVVMGHDTVDGPPDGTIARRRFTNVWQMQDGGWRSIARHAQVVSRGPVA